MICGIDISHLNDPKINIPFITAQDIGFVWIKATQALTFQDPTFQDYWHEIKSIPNNENGEQVKRGGYHFFDPRVDGIAQAKNYLSRGIDFTLPGVLPPCIDIEDLVGINASDTVQINKWVATNWKVCLQCLNDFLGYVKQQTTKDCIIYTYNNYPKEYYPGAKFTNNRMWLSSLQANCPVRYDTNQLPDFWQNTYRFNDTDLDGDYFMGTQEQLNEMCNIKKALS